MTNLEPDGDDRLSELLRQAVPDGPDPAGRARDVVRRAHRANRRRGAAGVAAVGIVALAVVAGPSLVDSGGERPATSETAATDTSAEARNLEHPVTCAASGSSALPQRRHAAEGLPRGAVLARLCPPAGTSVFPDGWSPSADALTTGVDSLIRTVNGLPRLPPTVACAGNASRYGYTLFFQYADGSTVRIDGDVAGCRIVSTLDGDFVREGADTILATYLQSLREQRVAAGAVPPHRARPECPHSSGQAIAGLLPTNADLTLVSAVVCQYAYRSEALVGSGSLTGQEIAAFVSDYRAGVSRPARDPDCLNPVPETTMVIAKSAWGDTVVMYGSCNYFMRIADYLDKATRWNMSRAVADMLGRAARR